MAEEKSLRNKRILVIEPFYGGSHKQLIDCLINLFESRCAKYDLLTLPAKKWHWRARTSALYMSQIIPTNQNYHSIFCSSVLNLAELIALREDLKCSTKIIYFHENQFIYPTQDKLFRDFQYGYNTILSALVADHVLFNSHYNKDTFLGNVSKHLRKQPDFRIAGLENQILPKCSVIYFPVKIENTLRVKNFNVLHIVWPHRWEHDKDPKLFFETMFKLKDEGMTFILSVLGEAFEEMMPIFKKAQECLAGNIVHFGHLKSRNEYIEVLIDAHVVVSTAKHEFFGVAMMEAVKCGCYPLAPKSLVYPELYPAEYLYKTPNQLFRRLKMFCERPITVQECLQSHKISQELLDVSRIELQLAEKLSLY